MPDPITIETLVPVQQPLLLPCGCSQQEYENVGVCPNCGQCDDCCECCICGNCGKKLDSDEICPHCNDCLQCHDCFFCSSCGWTDSDNYCSNCECCVECHNCYYCEGCGKFYSEGCTECDCCDNCCACGGTNFVQKPWSERCDVSNLITQKAIGLAVLANAGFPVPNFSVYKAKALKGSLNLDTILNSRTWFTRPCPVRPRHGFVESCIVKNSSDFNQLVIKTLKADEEAEILLMPYIEASHSAVWSPGYLAIGPGHDGATAGKDAISLPVLGTVVDGNLWSRAKITNSPYVEIVYSMKNSDDYNPFADVHFVQLRDGPSIPTEIDYIPCAVKVKKVHIAKGDLLKWEKKVQRMRPDRDIVWHPLGVLSSHYAVHCIAKGIAVLTSHEPIIGELLEPNSASEVVPNAKHLQQGFKEAMAMEIGQQKAARFMLAALHNAAVWKGRYDYLFGVGMGLTYRLALIACLGELRHQSKYGKLTGYIGSGALQRQKVYDRAWDKAWRWKRRMAAAYRGFADTKSWKPGFGGSKWAIIAGTGLELYSAVASENYSEALASFNKLVNLVHNADWAFNKFITSSEMTRISKCAAIGAIMVAPVLYKAQKSFVPKKLKSWKPIPIPDIPFELEEAPKTKNKTPYEGCECPECLEAKKKAETVIKEANKIVVSPKPWEPPKKKKKKKKVKQVKKAQNPVEPNTNSKCNCSQCQSAAGDGKLGPHHKPTAPMLLAQVTKKSGKIYLQASFTDGTRASKYIKNTGNGSLLIALIEEKLAKEVYSPSMCPGSETKYIPLTPTTTGFYLEGYGQVIAFDEFEKEDN